MLICRRLIVQASQPLTIYTIPTLHKTTGTNSTKIMAGKYSNIKIRVYFKFFSLYEWTPCYVRPQFDRTMNLRSHYKPLYLNKM